MLGPGERTALLSELGLPLLGRVRRIGFFEDNVLTQLGQTAAPLIDRYHTGFKPG